MEEEECSLQCENSGRMATTTVIPMAKKKGTTVTILRRPATLTADTMDVAWL